MIYFIFKKFLEIFSTLILISVVVFFFTYFLPGDPVKIISGVETDISIIAAINHELGLDQPMLKQLWEFITYAIRGNFGISIVSKRLVIDEIYSHFMPTLCLTIITITWTLIFGIFLGIISTIYFNRWLDTLIVILTTLGISLPTFALGILLIQIFSVYLDWFSILDCNSIKNYILPSITSGTSIVSIITRVTRTSFIEIMKKDYIRTARAKGLKETVIIIQHGLRNAIIPIITMMGLQFGFLLGGLIVVESIFNWPGLGKLLIDSIMSRDYPVIRAIILFFSLEFMLISLLLDLINVFINPKIKFSQ